MTHGKNICNQLKEVRKRIAEENDIPLEIEECTYKGECRGTCPRCEAEVRYLENALADRLRLGKVATVAGLALGLAATAQAQAPVTTIPATPQDTDTTHKVMAKGVLKGFVVDAKTNEPIPFCNVVVKQDGRQVHGGATDFDGIYTIKPLPMGVYTVEIVSPGYRRFERDGIHIKASGFTVLDVSMVSTNISQADLENSKIPIIMCGGIGSDGRRVTREDIENFPSPCYYDSNPLSWPDPFVANPPFQVFEKEGVQVIVR